MLITNGWKLSQYGVKRDHNDKFINIRELLERIAYDWFNNIFKTDTGTPENNIPSLDDIDNEGTVSTCCSLHYSISSPHNPEISKISNITIATSPTTAIDRTALKEVQLEWWRSIGWIGVTAIGGYLMERYVWRGVSSTTTDVLFGLGGGPTTVNIMAVTDLYCIVTH